MRKHDRPLPADILTRLERVRELLADHPRVIFAYLFSGLARGEPKPLSDVDIAVYLEDTADPISAKLDLIGMITAALAPMNSISSSSIRCRCHWPAAFSKHPVFWSIKNRSGDIAMNC